MKHRIVGLLLLAVVLGANGVVRADQSIGGPQVVVSAGIPAIPAAVDDPRLRAYIDQRIAAAVSASEQRAAAAAVAQTNQLLNAAHRDILDEVNLAESSRLKAQIEGQQRSDAESEAATKALADLERMGRQLQADAMAKVEQRLATGEAKSEQRFAQSDSSIKQAQGEQAAKVAAIISDASARLQKLDSVSGGIQQQLSAAQQATEAAKQLNSQVQSQLSKQHADTLAAVDGKLSAQEVRFKQALADSLAGADQKNTESLRLVKADVGDLKTQAAQTQALLLKQGSETVSTVDGKLSAQDENTKKALADGLAAADVRVGESLRQVKADVLDAKNLATSIDQKVSVAVTAQLAPQAKQLSDLQTEVQPLQALQPRIDALESGLAKAATATDLAAVKSQSDKNASAARDEAASLVSQMSQNLKKTIDDSQGAVIDQRIAQARAGDTSGSQITDLTGKLSALRDQVADVMKTQQGLKPFDPSELHQALADLSTRLDQATSSRTIASKEAFKADVMAAVEAKLASLKAAKSPDLQAALDRSQAQNDRSRDAVLAEVGRLVDSKFDATTQLIQSQNEILKKQILILSGRIDAAASQPAALPVSSKEQTQSVLKDSDPGSGRFSVFHVFADEMSARTIYRDLSTKEVLDIALSKSREGSYEIFAGEFTSAAAASERQTALRRLCGIDFSVAPVEN